MAKSSVLKTDARKGLWVRVPLPPLTSTIINYIDVGKQDI